VNRPNIGSDRPSTLPGTVNRPNIGTDRPSTLPGNINRPNQGTNRPGTLPGNINRPNLGGERPTTLPGVAQRPGTGGTRPGINGNRPNLNIPGNTSPGANLPNINRPSVGNNINNGNVNINRPGIGTNRPGGNNINNGNININRPGFGTNRPGGNNIGNNVNIGNSVNINRPVNRPNWDLDPGFSRPGWGINSNNWNSNWHNNCINNRHNWYNGCWQGYWGSSWYAPVAWGAAGWGLNSLTSGWGNNVAYFNPYYAVPVASQEMPYDYSQPVVINNYVSSDSESGGGDTQVTQENSKEQGALMAFDNGLGKFKSGDYRGALSDFDEALKMLPGDAVVHETRCLALFAVADYSKAAGGLNSYLAVAPGMDWTTMSGLYGNAEDYTTQLRTLERYTDANPSDASSHFVLAYHYLVTGSKEAAIKALDVVVANQPKDVTAKRMLDALSPPETSSASQPAPAAAPVPTADADAPETDLVGTWLAQTGNSKIELGITEGSAFTWKAGGKDQPTVELKGTLNSLMDGIELVTVDQGTVAGAVKSNGADGWNFKIAGAPTTDPGLEFKRLK
jgi:tetratricopeptide (TPR) repeat protein